MPEGILGRKLGMTVIYLEDGRQVPVTVIDTKGNKVLGKRTESANGYTAVIIGFGEKKAKRANKPLLGFYTKHDLLDGEEGSQTVKQEIREFRIGAEALAGYEVGETFAGSKLFKSGDVIDVVGISKGRGFTGVMKRYHFKGSKASHGQHEYKRHGGSIAPNTYPAHVFKGKRMGGQHGNARTTLQNIKIVQVMEAEGLVLVKGGVPGPTGGFVRLQRAVKKQLA
ncbi:50S ribosomal protein L3 [Myxococcota bacterium]|jgi:large subunit ribosomal protein L3|nr:50S ribosomal protein L3 [Myxococcota bacterium]